MQGGYTQQAIDFYLDEFNCEMAKIRNEIESTSEETTAEQWTVKLQKIVDEFCLSGRFGLLRILQERAKKTKVKKKVGLFDAADLDYEKELEQIGGSWDIDDINYAKNLTPEENLQYFNLLLKVANRRPDADEAVNKVVIGRIWHHDVESANSVSELLLDEELFLRKRALNNARKEYETENKKRYTTRIKREEVLQMGHILDFSLEEIQWFLLRTLDTEDGLRFNKSDDVIEAYGFLTHASWQRVEHLKTEYEAISGSIEKNNDDSRNNQWTARLSNELPTLVESWNQDPETRDARFMAWMQSKAGGLDINSRTAVKLYRNLAAAAYGLVIGESEIPDEDDFLEFIQDICSQKEESDEARRHLYKNGVISKENCKRASQRILYENRIMSASIKEDSSYAWHVLTLQNNKEFSPGGGVINENRARLSDVLFGNTQVEKGDMLYLLWFIANLSWQMSGVADTSTLYCRVQNFLDASKLVLETALLPKFYPPHLMEQTMLISIVSETEECDASVFYEYMLYSLTKHRNSKKNKTKETEKPITKSRT